MGNLKETHNVFLRFFFQKHFLCFCGKNFGNHKTCLLMDFSGGNTTWCQQCDNVADIFTKPLVKPKFI